MILKTIAKLKEKTYLLAPVMGAWLTVTNTGVNLEPADLTKVGEANSAYLNSAFQIVDLLPYIAIIGAGFYILNKLFSIIPSWSWK